MNIVFQKGMIRGSLLALEHLRVDKGGNGGVIVNISSAAGWYYSIYFKSFSQNHSFCFCIGLFYLILLNFSRMCHSIYCILMTYKGQVFN